MLGGMGGDLAKSLHGYGLAAQRVAAPGVGGTGPHAHVDAQAGHDGGVAAAAEGHVQADDVLGFLVDGFEVAAGGSDVGGGEVAAAESVDEAAPGAEETLGLVGARVADDDALAAAQVQAGGRRFVGHGLGEPESVGQCVGLGGVGPHSGAAAGGAEGSIVNRDDAAEAGLGVAVHGDLLVTVFDHLVENVHCIASSINVWMDGAKRREVAAWSE